MLDIHPNDNLDQGKPALLYTVSKVLAVAEIGDNLTTIQKKTGFSFATVKKAIDTLEEAKRLVRTEVSNNTRGKARICIEISKRHQKVARFFVDALEGFCSIYEENVDRNALLPKIDIFEEILSRIIALLEEPTEALQMGSRPLSPRKEAAMIGIDHPILEESEKEVKTIRWEGPFSSVAPGENRETQSDIVLRIELTQLGKRRPRSINRDSQMGLDDFLGLEKIEDGDTPRTIPQKDTGTR